jgi:hypothetical protein
MSGDGNGKCLARSKREQEPWGRELLYEEEHLGSGKWVAHAISGPLAPEKPSRFPAEW